MKNKIFGITLALSLSLPIMGHAQSSFSDIDQSYAKNNIEALASKGLLSGYPDGTFKPFNQVTRLEFAVMLSRALDLDNKYSAQYCTLTDVPDWARGAVGGLQDAGLVKGIGNNLLGADLDLTREDLAGFMWNAMGQPTPKANPSFQDFDQVDDYAQKAVAYLSQINFIVGDGANYHPHDSSERQAVAKLIYLFNEKGLALGKVKEYAISDITLSTLSGWDWKYGLTYQNKVDAIKLTIDSLVKSNQFYTGSSIDYNKVVNVVDIYYPQTYPLNSGAIGAITKALTDMGYTTHSQKLILGECTTTIPNMQDSGRVANIKKALEKLNGTVIQPNQQSSFNNIVGERTAEGGWQMAHIILNGEFADGIGGGICQASTTLYNAIDNARMEVDELHHHSLHVGYVPEGRDATVSWGSLDLKFTNNHKTPIKILAGLNGKYVTIQVIAVQ